MLNSDLGNYRLPTQIPPSVSIRYSINFLPDTYAMSLTLRCRRAAAFQARGGSVLAVGKATRACITLYRALVLVFFLSVCMVCKALWNAVG